MRNFAFGMTLGVFTGWMFHESITRIVQDAVNTAHNKIDDLEKTSPVTPPESPPTTPDTQP